MKRLACFSLLLCSITFSSFSQIILPKFEPAIKVERLSDESEESNIFTYYEGNNIFYYRTYVKGEGNEMEVLRQNIWYSQRENGKWEKPDRLFRMDEYEGENIIIGTSEDGNKVYIFQTIYHPTEDSLERRIGFIERQEKNKWSEFSEITIPGLVLGENYYHFHLSHDESVLMMSMSPNDELLNEDIFVSIKGKDGNWGKIIDLGPTINTPRVEISPYIDNDDRTLYFSSEGHGGFGGSDVFVSYRLDDSWTNWTKPVNLGESINTRDYEEYFVHTRTNEYFFTSTRGEESADIYYTSSDYAVELNKGKALVMKENVPMATMINIHDEAGTVYDKATSAEDGTFNFKIKESVEALSFSGEEIHSEGAFIYTLDDEGAKRERRIIGIDFKSINEEDQVNDQKVACKINSNGAPLANVEVEVFDINMYKLGKVSTDEKGLAEFQSTKVDKRLIFVPATESAWEIESAQLFDSENNFVSYLEVNEGKVDKEKVLSEEEVAALMKKKKEAAEKPVTAVATAKPTKTETTPMSSAPAGVTSQVQFGFNAVSLNRKEERKLRSVTSHLKDNPNTKVTLVGNTDAEGEDQLNMDIGKRRALFVKRVLVRDGIDPNRITVKSDGKSNPIASNDDESGRSQNRRVEIKFQ